MATAVPSSLSPVPENHVTPESEPTATTDITIPVDVNFFSLLATNVEDDSPPVQNSVPRESATQPTDGPEKASHSFSPPGGMWSYASFCPYS